MLKHIFYENAQTLFEIAQTLVKMPKWQKIFFILITFSWKCPSSPIPSILHPDSDGKLKINPKCNKSATFSGQTNLYWLHTGQYHTSATAVPDQSISTTNVTVPQYKSILASHTAPARTVLHIQRILVSENVVVKR